MNVRRVIAGVTAAAAIASPVWAKGAAEPQTDGGANAPLEIKMTVRLFDQVPDMNNAY